MNSTIELLLSHRSVRRFKPEPVTDEALDVMIRSAQMASSSSNMQAYSIIRVSDPEKRSRIRLVTGQQYYVEQAPLFLVFCADLMRLETACRMQGAPLRAEGIEPFLVASVDAALAAQNAAVAAEALGLGICYIGSIRNDPEEVTRVLELPPLVYPVFGMCIGHPDQEPAGRPRLPIEAVLHTDRYDASLYEEQLERYDAVMRDYYRERTGGKKDTSWSEEMAAKHAAPQRTGLKPYLRDRGFDV
jgi:FMN reductase (NADPH)